MTKFKGMLLFDWPDPPINNWHESCGGRGMYDLWWFVGENDNKCDQLENGKCLLDGEKCSCPNCAYLHNHSQFLMIEPYEDSEPNCDCCMWRNSLGECELDRNRVGPCDEFVDVSQEVWLGDDDTGNCTTVGIFDDYETALKEAKKFMREHPKGWMGEFE